jgi:hypothetical protein
VDSEVIPSLIFWKSDSFIFVLDGGHRLSALRAWIENDYGDGPISQRFYNNEISEQQKRIAKRTRTLVEDRVGRFQTLKSLVGQRGADPIQSKRASALFTRPLTLQWVQGSPEVAETSFFKINSQGTPLDDTESMLIENRRKPIAICARAIIRSGAGHKYWSKFTEDKQKLIEQKSAVLYQTLFDPEVNAPIKTLDIPLGGSVSPVDALSLLVDFLAIAGSNGPDIKTIDKYDDDETGDSSIRILDRAIEIASRITGNSPASLGLHPAVYFYNEKGKHSRFLFLGTTLLVEEKLRNNNTSFFKRFTLVRSGVEQFLMDNKSLIGILLQNLNRKQRVPKMRDLLNFLVVQLEKGNSVTPEAALSYLGARGRVFDVTAQQAGSGFSDDTKSMAFIKQAVAGALKCPVCGGLLDPAKSVHYDHKIPKRKGGRGDADNIQLVHPYCNTGIKG